MPIKIKKISEIIGKRVYTDSGDYFGEVEEANLVENKIDSWRIKVSTGIGNFLGGARGVVIPHQFVKAIGDICVVSKASLPVQEEMDGVMIDDGSGTEMTADEEIEL